MGTVFSFDVVGKAGPGGGIAPAVGLTVPWLGLERLV